jgi:hypothetical protein
VVGQAVEQRGGHLGVAEHFGLPLTSSGSSPASP